MSRILITGGAGFIGSFLVDELVKKGHRVTIYDNLDTQVHINGKSPDYLNPEAEFIHGDVCNYDAFKKVISDNEIIFHFAAKVGVGQSQYEIKRYVDVNIGGTANLLDILVNTKNKVKKVVVAGSMSSYGEGLYKCKKCGVVQPNLRPEEQLRKNLWGLYCPRRPAVGCNNVLKPVKTPENAQLNCNSIYALTKKAQEEMSLVIGKTYKIPTVVFRFFNVYGPRQSLSNPYTGVAAIFMSRIKNNNPPVIFEDGLQTRDFIYVSDIVKVCIIAMENDKADYDVFNVGSGNPLTILEIAQTISRVYNKDIEPEVTNSFRKGDVRHCYADISKIKSKLGFKPGIDFYTGIKKLTDWAKTSEAIDKYTQAQKELKEKSLI
jgi:dTDP-L-rhamnose 4-epimerase